MATNFTVAGIDLDTRYHRRTDTVENSSRLDGILPTEFMRSNDSETSQTGNTKWLAGKSFYIYDSSAGGRVPAPGGAGYIAPSSPQTGVLKIALPTHGTADMMFFEITVFEYGTGESFKVYVGGYPYIDNVWHNVTAFIISEEWDKDYTIRFGTDGFKNCIWIGESNSTWAHPQIMVQNFCAGYSTNILQYASNWDVTVTPNLGTIHHTIQNNYPASQTATVLHYNNAGRLTPTATGVTVTNAIIASKYNTSSSARYKENIEEFKHTDNFMKLRPTRYKSKLTERQEIGMIAEEVDKLYPEFVHKENGRVEGITYSKFFTLSVAKLKEQQKEIAELQKEIKDLLD